MNKAKIYKKNVKIKRYYFIKYYMVPKDRSTLGVYLGFWFNPFDKSFKIKDFFYKLLGKTYYDLVCISDVYYCIYKYDNKGCISFSSWELLI